jgi:hypothetical protein
MQTEVTARWNEGDIIYTVAYFSLFASKTAMALHTVHAVRIA